MAQILVTPRGTLTPVRFANEAELEQAINVVSKELFGRNRIYIDVKRKIARKDGKQNIPDGYLLDLRNRKPRLYVIENEHSNHDPLRHVELQLLEFSLAFDSSQLRIKQIVSESLQENSTALQQCEQYAREHGYRNVDHVLDTAIYDHPFSAVVIINEMSDMLETALAKKFSFGVEVIEINRFKAVTGEYTYLFEPFLYQVDDEVSLTTESVPVDVEEIDTIIVPAHEEGFREVFLGENQWRAVRIHGTMRPQIKHIAVYRIRPLSAITHIAPVASIEPWGESGKFALKFAEPAHEIEPIRLVPNGRVKSPQNIRYTSLARLLGAKNLDEVF
jgi:hypothetical protein